MPLSIVCALGAALLGSLGFLGHTIYRRPAVVQTAPQRKRFPIAGAAAPVLTPEPVGTNTIGEVDAAYAEWLHTLNAAYADRALASSTGPTRP
jgi:hypothetical protein